MAADNAVDALGDTLSSEAAGVPLWVWLAGGAAVAAVAILLLGRRGGTASPSSTRALSLPPLAGGAGGGGGGSDTSTSTSTSKTNGDWLTKAVAAAAAATGVDKYTVSLYLQQFLAGASPQGSSTAYSAFDRVVQAALQASGAPPQSIAQQNTSNSIFQTVGQWLNAGLATIQNVPADVRSELIRFVSGQTSTLSPAAANVLGQITDTIGSSPSTLSYTVSGGGGGSVNAAAVQSAIAAFQKATYTSPLEAFSAWTGAIKSNIPGADKLSTAQLAQIFNLINQSVGSDKQKISPFRDVNQVASFFNEVLANPAAWSNQAAGVYWYNGEKIVYSPFAPNGPGNS